MPYSAWTFALAATACLAGQPARAAAPAIELLGRGVQIYDCAASGAGFAWQLKAPDAMLLDGQGRPVGHHFAGPSWQATDGSLVTGDVVASSSGAAGAVPWLVLRAKSHAGEGIFATVRYIVRSQTVGGAAPGAGCDAGHAGAETRVDYHATYTLFPDGGANAP